MCGHFGFSAHRLNIDRLLYQYSAIGQRLLADAMQGHIFGYD